MTADPREPKPDEPARAPKAKAHDPPEGEDVASDTEHAV